jgi:hypothetical protein
LGNPLALFNSAKSKFDTDTVETLATPTQTLFKLSIAMGG